MKRIRVYRNPNCARCAKFAKVARFFDWLGRLDHFTEAPKTGPLRIGEVVVEDLSKGQIFRGADAPMPLSVQISGNYFIHGFSSVPRRPMSHGCIRLPLENGNPAKQFFDWVEPGTPIEIIGEWKR